MNNDEKKVAVAILSALTVCDNPMFSDWANDWLNDIDRSAKSASNRAVVHMNPLDRVTGGNAIDIMNRVNHARNCAVAYAVDYDEAHNTTIKPPMNNDENQVQTPPTRSLSAEKILITMFLNYIQIQGVQLCTKLKRSLTNDEVATLQSDFIEYLKEDVKP